MNAVPRPKDKLVDSALTLFAEKGYTYVTEEELLHHSKVSRGILVYHFGTKEGLLHEVFRQYQPTVAAIIPNSPAHPTLDLVISTWLNTLEHNPTWWLCYFRLYLHLDSQKYLEGFEPFRAVFAQYHQLLHACFKKRGISDVEAEVWAFESFRIGASIQYLLQPEGLPLMALKEIWLSKFSTQ